MSVTIVGIGLMGGSLSLALQETGYCEHIIGVDKNKSYCLKALELGLIQEVQLLEDAIHHSDIIVICTPVLASLELVGQVLDRVLDHQVVIDLGSTKSALCHQFKNHPMRKNYVAAHPIAGTENSGPEAASPDLYKNKKVVICEKQLSSEVALLKASALFTSIGMQLVFMSPDEHDKHLAYISHLSHISSFALGLTVLSLEKDEQNIFNLAGSGFSSTVRLAKSSPEMWKAIFSQNKEHILPALEAYIDFLKGFRSDIASNNEEELVNKMNQANNIRKIIK